MSIARVRVVIVDDSASSREMLAQLLTQDGDIEIVGEAGDGREALSVVAARLPDVVTMELSMPRLGGLEALALLMERTPVPVLIVTGEPLGDESELAFEAMQVGAVDLVPKSALRASADGGRLFRERVREAARIPVFTRVSGTMQVTAPPNAAEKKVVTELVSAARVTVRVVGIGAGRGGSRTMTRLLTRLPPDLPCAVVIAQPTPAGYEEAYARFLRASAGKRVTLVKRDAAGVELEPGVVFLAGADAHLVVTPDRTLALADGPPQHGARPSADRLLRSMAEVYGDAALGVIVSGRGNDGATGLRAIRSAGGWSLVELPEAAAAPEMPTRARAAAERAVHVELLANAIIALTYPPAAETKRHPARRSLAKRKRIYVLDDGTHLLETASAALEEAGFEVVHASSLAGLEALLAKASPDLFITDVETPEMYGKALGTILRRIRDVGVPVLLWSSFDKESLAEALREAPVDGYIPKSEGVAALVEGVRASLAQAS